jgi:hypothetical protein
MKCEGIQICPDERDNQYTKMPQGYVWNKKDPTYVDMFKWPALNNAAKMYPMTAEPTTAQKRPTRR